MAESPIRWAARVPHVREVSLRGAADAELWTERLRGEELVPIIEDGKAQILIIAADLRYLGIRFRELSISVLVQPPGASTGEAAFLVQAWSTSRLLAWCERALFSAPYARGEVAVAAGSACSVHLATHDDAGLQAAAASGHAASERGASPLAEGGWAGPVFLPGRRGASGAQGKCFFARIAGLTRSFPFVRAIDSFAIRGAPGSEALESLAASCFAPRAWAVREDALHAKSRTCSRAAAIRVLTSKAPGVA